MYKIRPPKDQDFEFVVDSWLKSYKKNNPSMSSMDWKLYAPMQRDVIVTMLSRSEIYISCSDQDEDQILGYMIFERANAAIHYVYVKSPVRRFGIAKRLIECVEGKYYTHDTFEGKRLAEKYGFEFNPFLVWRSNESERSTGIQSVIDG
jgi:GNAT superfamily N-acetyltransferase